LICHCQYLARHALRHSCAKGETWKTTMAQRSTTTIQAPAPALEKVPTAARRAAISVSQAYREIKAGRLGPLVKLGARSSAVPAESVDAWIAARIAEATNKNGGEKIGGAA
jgi:prophage regulatory protein